MPKYPLFIAGLFVTILTGILLFLIPSGPESSAAIILAMFGLAVGLALSGAGYVLKV